MAAAAQMGCGLKSILLLGLLAGTLPAATWHITVSGLGGEPDYEQRFTALAQEAHKLVSATPGAKAELLTGASATRAALKSAIERAASAGPNDSFVLLLIGHGTFDGAEYRFNLPGPDVTGTDLRAWLDRINCPQLIVVGSSSSGAAIAALQKPNRAVVTATKSGTEKLAVVFARYWVEALRDPAADADKNETVNALEAFRYADAKVAKYYESQKRLATEHALLEDTGSGDGVRSPSPDNGRGLLASRLTLVRFGAIQESLQNPAKQELLARREQLQQAIDKLKYEKAAMPTGEYQTRLRALLVDLANVEDQLER